MKKHSIFISYRRSSGGFAAKALLQCLQKRHYSVFLDLHALPSGNYGNHLFEAIDGCLDFLLVLTPGDLDRCQDPQDWVRQEMERARKQQKNIIPVMIGNFVFPQNLPQSIAFIAGMNGIQTDMVHMVADVERMCKLMLKSKPGGSWGRLLIAALAIVVLLAGGGFAGYRLLGGGGFPATAREKSAVSELLSYTETHLTQMDLMAGGVEDALSAMRGYLNAGSTEDAALRNAFELARAQLEDCDQQSCAPDDGFLERVGELRDAAFPAAEVEAMHDTTALFRESWLGYLDYLEQVADPDFFLLDSARMRILDSYETILEEELKGNAYCANELLLPITNPRAMTEFRSKFLPGLLHVPLSAASWSTDREALESEIDAVSNRQQAALQTLLTLVGNTAMTNDAMRANLIDIYMNLGLSREDAEKAVENQLLLADLRLQYLPEEGDGEESLWMKVAIAVAQHDWDAGSQCADALNALVGGSDPYAAEYIPALHRYLDSAEALGIDYGTMIIGWGDPARPSERYRIGDVIIAFDGAVCRNYDEYVTMKQALSGDEFRVTVLRADEAGVLQRVELDMRTDMQPAYMTSLDGTILE